MLSTLLSLLGIALGLLSVTLTHATFFAPGFWLTLALRRPDQWDRLVFDNERRTIYRHRQLSGFSIEVSEDAITDEYYERWLDGVYRADTSSSSCEVIVRLNGLPYQQEVFVYFDGHSNFVPQPRMVEDGNLVRFQYDHVQRAIARIVGYTHLDHSIDDLMNQIVSSSTSAVLRYTGRHCHTDMNSLDLKIQRAKKKLERA